MSDQTAKPSRHHIWRVSKRTLSKAWDDSIFAESAQAGFWSVLSLPPLLLGMLGSLAYIAPLFGPATLATIEDRLVSTAASFFSDNVVTEIIEPTMRDIVQGARGEVVSLGFVISLWAGSSAISAFVDAIVEAHDQTPLRHPVRQRFYALGLYVVGLLIIIISAPFLALGPSKVAEYIPDSWDNVLRFGYYPALALGFIIAITVLYRVSLPRPLPTHRLVIGAVLATTVFMVATVGLRIYLSSITRTGYTYGALATPIAFLLFAFFLGFAIMIGAELNNAIEEEWPAPATHTHQLRSWLEEKATAKADGKTARPVAQVPDGAPETEQPAWPTSS
ncbi:YihY/virulence factor BrkB family protein [[Mycobacterium] burgundiense]|uniref:YihY/virulence factor BrkB family protein n=1 Tax=[Mycobacterium] burgundiense TaxID=3064286 RepID=A0ABM9LWE9_9MYCO|nr:YihY/virulence factor BrkB family protein [Mycolicibacterium sp. MU0053]CAJ1505867.1 YihY/virulence factor BrkB family protein [Mycolicibacterium sp. MU0053]